MGSLNLLAGGLTVCLAVSLCRSEVTEDNYNALITKLSARIMSDGGGSYIKQENDNIEPTSELYPKVYGCCKNDTNEMIRFDEEQSIVDTAKSDGEKGYQDAEDDSIFIKGIRDIRYFYEECRKKISRRSKTKFELGKRSKLENELFKIEEKVRSLYNCMKVTSFRHLDDFLSDAVIPVMPHLELVRDFGSETTAFSDRKYDTNLYEFDIINKNWSDLITERIEKLLNGHSLKIHLKDNEPQVSGRGRRRDHRMFAMMMMGFIIMASILVPMGFQFLTVLGGKSLLMAKMALIMSAINGLKKIATSNVGYGLYHAPEAFHHEPHHHGFHEKIFHIKPQEQPNSPFNIVI